MTDENLFGGKNPHGAYVPLTETEQEVLHRLVNTQDLVVEIKGFGTCEEPQVRVGDHRVQVIIDHVFDRPEIPRDTYWLDLCLKTRATGIRLFQHRYATVHDGLPVKLGGGLRLGFQWDIALSHLDPKLVKKIKPGALGLTSRVLDKETGDRTFRGNMNLTPDQEKVLAAMRQNEKRLHQMDSEKVEKAQKQQKAAEEQSCSDGRK